MGGPARAQHVGNECSYTVRCQLYVVEALGTVWPLGLSFNNSSVYIFHGYVILHLLYSSSAQPEAVVWSMHQDPPRHQQCIDIVIERFDSSPLTKEDPSSCLKLPFAAFLFAKHGDFHSDRPENSMK